MKVVFHATFVKRFQKCSPKIQQAFEERLELFLKNPYHPLLRNHAVGRAYPGCRSINVTGDMRAIYHMHEGACVFVLIGTHAELYG
jgi:addiction module RelE/StbE family toxin